MAHRELNQVAGVGMSEIWFELRQMTDLAENVTC